MTWIQRDARLLLFAHGMSTFAYAFLAIVLPIYLSILGYDSVTIGIVVGAGILGSAFQTVAMGMVADRIGRRNTLVVLSLLMTLSGILYSYTEEFLPLLLASLIAGSGGPGSGVPGGGAYIAVNNALLTGKVTDEKRNSLFAVNSAVASLGAAGGSLFSSVPDLMSAVTNQPIQLAVRTVIILYALLGIVTIAAILPVKEAARPKTRTNLLPKRSVWLAKRLTVTGFFDGFGTGFILPPVTAYWFHIKFGTGLSGLGTFFFLLSLTTTASYYLSLPLAKRFGSVNTIFFTHMPSALLLMATPFAPSFEVAAAIFLARPLISQIDVPLRQSYMMAMAHPDERASIAGIAGVSKTAPSALSPPVAGYAIQRFSLASPFLASGFLMLTSDLLFYLFFRKVRPPEELRAKS